MRENVWQVYEVTCLQVKLMAKYSENLSDTKFAKAFAFFDIISKIFPKFYAVLV